MGVKPIICVSGLRIKPLIRVLGMGTKPLLQRIQPSLHPVNPLVQYLKQYHQQAGQGDYQAAQADADGDYGGCLRLHLFPFPAPASDSRDKAIVAYNPATVNNPPPPLPFLALLQPPGYRQHGLGQPLHHPDAVGQLAYAEVVR